MTVGTSVVGKYAYGYCRSRNWSGTDGARSVEHPYVVALRESYLPRVQYSINNGKSWLGGSMDTFSPQMPYKASVPHWQNCLNKCSNKVWGQLTQSKFNAGVFAVEYRESYRQVTSIVHGLAKGIQLIKKGRFSEAIYVMTGSNNKTPLSIIASNHYMAWHFGILPTLADLKALVDYLQSDHTVVKRVRASSSYSERARRSQSTVSWLWTLKAGASIRGEVKVQDISEIDRLGLSDPVDAMYQGTRLSWLLDWVLPIGNMLAAQNASRQTAGNMFFQTTYQKEFLEQPLRGSVLIDPFAGDSFDFLFTRLKREPIYSLPWAFPTISNPLGDNLSRWVTAAAFLRQSVK